MKKVVLSVLLILVFAISFNFILASDVSLQKASFYPGETLQVEISGNFPDGLKLENMAIYRNDSIHPVPAESNIFKAEGKYFYYAILPTEPGSYIMKIENVRHIEGNKDTTDPINTTFLITDTNNSYLSFSPGYIYTSNDFQIIITAYNKDQQINVDFSPQGFSESFTKGYGETETVDIPITNIKNFTKSTIKINSYTLPIYVSPKQVVIVQPSNGTFGDLGEIVKTDVQEISATVLQNVDYGFQILLVNKQGSPLTLNISSTSPYISFDQKNISNFQTEALMNVTINAATSFNSTIRITSENGQMFIPVNITITKNQSAVNFSTTPINSGQSCTDFAGTKCDTSQTCSGVIKFASDGKCCIGQCQSQSSSSSSWVWGIVILLIVGGVIFFFYKKSNNPMLKEKFQQIFKKRTDDYSKRINPSPQEVRGGLAKS